MSDFTFGVNGFISLTSTEPDDSVYLVIPGEPVSKERPRFSSKTGHAYTPVKTRDAEKAIANRYVRESGKRFAGPVSLSIVFFMGTKRRKDIDNMTKLIQDSLNGIAFEDDFQVHELTAVKRYTTPDRARAEIVLRQLATVEVEESHHDIQKKIVS